MPRSGDVTRRRILESAYTLFYRRGFSRVGVGEIAAAARLTKRSLYYHFKSKDALLAAVLEEQNKIAQVTYRKWMDRLSGAPEEIIEAIFSEIASWSKKPRWSGSGFTRLVIELADLPGHPARAIARRHKAMLEVAYTELFEKAGVSSPRELARYVCLLGEGAVSLILTHGDQRYAIAAGEAAKELSRSRQRPTKMPRRTTPSLALGRSTEMLLPHLRSRPIPPRPRSR